MFYELFTGVHIYRRSSYRLSEMDDSEILKLILQARNTLQALNCKPMERQ